MDFLDLKMIPYMHDIIFWGNVLTSGLCISLMILALTSVLHRGLSRSLLVIHLLSLFAGVQMFFVLPNRAYGWDSVSPLLNTLNMTADITAVVTLILANLVLTRRCVHIITVLKTLTEPTDNLAPSDKKVA